MCVKRLVTTAPFNGSVSTYTFTMHSIIKLSFDKFFYHFVVIPLCEVSVSCVGRGDVGQLVGWVCDCTPPA